MAYELADAYISLVPSFKGGGRQIQRELTREMGGQSQKAGRSIGGSILGGIAKGVAIGGGIVAALGLRNLGREVAAAASGIQNTTATLTGLLGSASAAADTMTRLRNVARTSPIDYQTYLAAGESLAYLGVSGEQAEGILRNVGAAITAAGGSGHQMESVSDALLKMVNSGRVYAEDLNRISDAGVPVFSGLAEHFNTNIANVREMVQSGAVGIEDVLAVMENASGGTFQSMLDASDLASQTFSNQWAIAKDNITTSLANGIMPLIEGLTPAMEKFAETAPAAIEDGIAGVTSAVTSMLTTIGEWRDKVTDFFATAEGQDLKMDTLERFESIWDNLSEAWEDAWPAIQSVAASLSRASAAIGISSWQLLLGVLDQLSGILNHVLIPMLERLAQWMEENPTLVTILVGAYTAWRIAQLALNMAMRANPIILVVSLIAGLIAWIITAYQTNETFREIVQKVWDTVKGAIVGAWNWIYDKAISPMVSGFQWVWDKAVEVKDGVVAAWNWMRDKLGAAWTWIRDNAINPILDGFQSAWDKAVEVKDGIQSAWETVAKVIGEAFDGIWDGIKSALNTVFGFINKWMISPLNKVLDPFDLAIPELPKLHSGGLVPGRGEKPYMLLGGEAVLNPAATKALGPDVVNALNRGEGFGGWPDWLSWDVAKQSLARGLGVASGQTALESGLKLGIDKLVDAGLRFLRPKKDNIPRFAWGPTVGTAINLGEAVKDWAASNDAEVAKQAGALEKGGVPDLSGGTSFVLPRGSYRVGVPLGGYPGHTGQDFPAPTGTPVFAPFAGQFSGVNLGNRSYGRYANVVAGGLRFIGAHLSALVGGNRFVQAGEMIGRVGSTGNSTGPHLHAEFRQGGVVQNPRKYLRFDTGMGVLDPGMNLVYNGTGGPEPLIDPRRWSTQAPSQVNNFNLDGAAVAESAKRYAEAVVTAQNRRNALMAWGG